MVNISSASVRSAKPWRDVGSRDARHTAANMASFMPESLRENEQVR